MNEHAWLTSTDPAEMLRYLDPGNARVGKVSDPDTSHLWTSRRLRLFAAACCRQVWDQLSDPRSRRAVEVAEKYAEGRATEEEAWGAETDFADILGPSVTPNANMAAANLLGWAEDHTRRQLWWVLHWMDNLVPSATQATLLRCIFGNPWRPLRVNEPLTCQRGHSDWAPVKKGSYPVPLSACLVCHEMGPPWPDVERGKAPAWLTPAVVSLARAIHADRDWAALPVLADLLEEAGCPARVEIQGPEILCDSKDVCSYCSRWPADSPHGEGGWVKCERWISEVPGDDYGRCGRCNRLWKVGYDIVKVVTYQSHPLLAHLRSGGPHALGCHALEAILGGTTP